MPWQEIRSPKERTKLMNQVKVFLGLRAYDLDKGLIKVSSSDNKLDAVLKRLEGNQQRLAGNQQMVSAVPSNIFFFASRPLSVIAIR